VREGRQPVSTARPEWRLAEVGLSFFRFDNPRFTKRRPLYTGLQPVGREGLLDGVTVTKAGLARNVVVDDFPLGFSGPE
jgi:hypothetical protein